MQRTLQLLICFFCFINLHAQNISGIVNTYHKVMEPSEISGGNEVIITIDNVSGLVEGQRVLMIQMKGAIVNTSENDSFGDIESLNNAGNYEFSSIFSINGNEITLSVLLNNYSTEGLVQLIGIPAIDNAIVTNTVTSPNWNPTTGKGGIVVLETCGSITLQADISVNGKGFLGGGLANNQSGCFNNIYANGDIYFGEKGEGISSNLSSTNNRSKGKNSNGGGGGIPNQSGGAGGSGFHEGGLGGNSNSVTFLCANNAKRAIGGMALNSFGFSLDNNRILMGGGGGSGTRNNSSLNSGGNGGGIVIIRANELISNGFKIDAGGGNANQPLTQTCGTGIRGVEDGAGGGGGAGAVMLDVNQVTGNLVVDCIGGIGGSTRYGSAGANRFFGPGGGGGGGMLWLSNPLILPSIVANTSGGLNGFARDNSCNPSEGNDRGANAGEGQTLASIKTDLQLIGLAFGSNITITASGNITNVCPETELTLSANSAVNWNIGVFAQNISVTESGNYFATIENACGNIQSNIISVQFAEEDSISITADALTICDENPISLSIDANYQNIEWSTEETEAVISIDSPGIYEVSALNTNGCEVSGNIEILPGENAFVEVTASNNGIICQNRSVELQASEGFASYVWNNDYIFSSIEITEPGAYFVNVVTENGCTGQSDTIYVEFQANPQASFDFSQVNGTYIINFTSTSTNTDSLTWIFENTEIKTGAQVNHTFPFDGFYEVTLIATNDCKSDTLNYTIEVEKLLSIHHLNSQFRVFPNPFNYYFQIESNFPLNNFEMFDYSGRKLDLDIEKSTIGNSLKINTDKLSKGIYLLKILSFDGVAFVRLVKN